MEIYPAGNLLCVDHMLYEHVGISDGKGMVFENSNARSGRGLVNYSDFAAGKGIIDLGILPGSLPVEKIIERARKLIQNDKSYHLLKNNCEHFVREVCGVEISTPQIQKAVLALISATIAIKATDPRVRGLAAGAAAGAMLSKTGEDSVKNSLIGASLGLLLGAVLAS
jgi:hypothetical protein